MMFNKPMVLRVFNALLSMSPDLSIAFKTSTHLLELNDHEYKNLDYLQNNQKHDEALCILENLFDQLAH